MVRKFLIVMSTCALLSMAAITASANGTQHYGPFMSTSPDSGSCGNNWATDTFERHFTVSNDGTRVTEEFKKGTFVTMMGLSPGSCENGNTPHTNVAGGMGKLEGSFDIVVSGGQFNPNAVCTTATCGTTAGFIATVFGTSASYNVTTYNLHYSGRCMGNGGHAAQRAMSASSVFVRLPHFFGGRHAAGGTR